MKNHFSLLASIAAGLCALLSCQPVHIYKTTYMYEVKLVTEYGVKEDVTSISNQLNAAVNPGTILSSPDDERIKQACSDIQKRYQENKPKSVYFKFLINKKTLDPSPDGAYVTEELATYEFGDALIHPYAFYRYGSDILDARENIRPLRETMDSELYKECGQTLYAVETAFSNLFSPFQNLPYLVSEENDEKIKKAVDEIYDDITTMKNAVIFTYIIARYDIRTLEPTELWKKAFPINLD